MAKDVHAIDPQLAANLRAAKDKLDAAKKEVEAAESAIYTASESFRPEKGTTHVTGVKIQTAFSSECDQPKLKALEAEWSKHSNLPFPFRTEFKPDNEAINYIRDNAKKAYDFLAAALTIKPKKPSFTLE